MRNKSLLLTKLILQQVREVKVVIFCEKVLNALAVMYEILSDVSFNGKREICKRSMSMLPLRLRELMLVNLLKR
jgi:uncharacterized protein YpiB (UPF0302 family)